MDHWNMFSKLMALSIVTAAMVGVGIALYVVPTIRALLWDEKRAAAASLVDAAYTIVQDLANSDGGGNDYGQRRAVQLSAIDEVSRIRFGQGGTFWILDLSGKMISNPNRPELVEKDVTNHTDAEGKKLYREMIDACRRSGAGFVRYAVRTKSGNKSDPRIAFVRAFPRWGWVIGCGLDTVDVDEKTRSILLRIAGAAAVAFSAAVLNASWMSRRISHRIRKTAAAVGEIAEGDLTARVTVAGNDEVGRMAVSVNDMAEKLQNAVSNLLASAVALASTAEELAASTGQIVSATEHGLEEARSTASAATELDETVVAVARDVVSVSGASDEGKKAASQGLRVVERTAEVVRQIATAMETAASAATDLGREAQRVEDVVEIINDIADQTKLLSLNAAVEAARAGEHGKGFSVVADEVRKLSEKTSEATRQVGDLIGSIRVKNQEMAESMTRGLSVVEHGIRLGEEARNSISLVDERVSIATERAQRIAVAAEQMSVTVRNMTQNIERIHQRAGETAGSASEISRGAEMVARKADQTRQILAQFRVLDTNAG